MIRYFLINSIRSLKRNKIFTLVNVFGLAIGFAFILIAGHYILQEYSFDKFNKNADNIYRLLSTSEDKSYRSSIFPATFLPEIQDKLPGLDSAVRITNNPGGTLFFNNEVHDVDNFIFTDYQFFNIFSCQLLEGDQNDLKVPFNLFISKSFAEKYFPNVAPVGQVILFDNNNQFTIKGIFKDIPENSVLQAQVIASFESLRTINPYLFNSWNARSTNIYLLLPDLNDHGNLIKKLSAVYYKIKPESEGEAYFELEPFLDIHLHSTDIRWDSVKKADIKVVNGILIFSLFILLISVFNHALLNTARLNEHMMQLRLKRIIGAGSRHIILQLAFESFLNVLISAILGFIIIEITLPLLKKSIGLDLNIDNFLDPSFIYVFIAVFGIIFIGIFLFTIVPVFNIQLNKSIIQKQSKWKYWIIRSNISLQFAFTIIMIASSYLMHQQIRLISEKNLGFDKSQLLMINNPDSYDMGKRYAQFKDKVQSLTGVMEIAGANNAPLENINNGGSFYVVPNKDDMLNAGRIWVSYNYFDVIGSSFIAGKNFRGNDESNKDNIIINETAYNRLGEKDVIGKELIYPAIRQEPFTIIGVIHDIQQEKATEENRAAVYFPPENDNDWGLFRIIIKLAPGNPENTLKKLNNIWHDLAPRWPFTYTFMDESINQVYSNEISSLHLLTLLTIISQFLSCLGIFGLSWFMVGQKTKEIGIRKVNGASTWNIFTLLNKDYVKWILPGLIIATPIAWYAVEKWLQNYAYKISIHWFIFVAAGLITTFIALISVSTQTIKAANANPADALKYE